MMDEAAHHSMQEDKHYKKYLEMPNEEESEDEDDEEVYQRKMKEKMEKDNEGKFSVNDILELKSPHTNFATEVSFRGYYGDKAVVWDKKNGNQFTVPKEWLKKK
jgi:hypothetical protein